jgi:UDP-N-acetylglucosamine 2-epimerase (non-hydrolysing)
VHKIAIVVGTRPEVIKLAPVIKAIRKEDGLEPCVISTGQQVELLKKALDEFEIKPDIEIDLNSGKTHLPEQFGNLVGQIGTCLKEIDSRYVLTQGDTSSAFAGAVAGFLLKIPVGHVEAGLRSHDLSSPFPEEGYRAMISRISTHQFAPTTAAVNNLISEGITESSIHLVGNTIVDSIVEYSSFRIQNTKVKKKVLVTLHRRENFGQPLRDIAAAIKDFAMEELTVQINVIVHPNPNSGLVLKELLADLVNVNLLEPLSYKDLLHEIRTSHFVLTDSGGIQEECAVLGSTLLIARNETERPEVLSESRMLIGTNRDRVYEALKMEVKRDIRFMEYPDLNLAILGDGQSSSRICRMIQDSM